MRVAHNVVFDRRVAAGAAAIPLRLIIQFIVLAEVTGQDAATVVYTVVLALSQGTDAELACYVALFEAKRPAVWTVSAA